MFTNKFFNFGLTILSALLVVGCSTNNQSIKIKTENTSYSPIMVNMDSIQIDGDLGNFILEKTTNQIEDGLQVITFKFTANSPSELKPVTLRFNFPSVDVTGFWNPTFADKSNYWRSAFSSKASTWAPTFTFYNNRLQNRITYSLSDALNKIEFWNYIKEEDVNFHPAIRLFSERMPKTKEYEIELRIDTRQQPYYEAISGVSDWWASMPEYTPLNVPSIAKRPMYSTWYSYHQSITAEEIIKESELAKSLGAEAVIVDDGWQTMDAQRGYAYTGDWEPDRIPDMKAFVDGVHAKGMKFLLWYSLPFMGENAKNYDRFKGKYLFYWNGQGTWVMDPRYPEVREYIINTYETALNEWDLDGFKLDFIGRFSAQNDTDLTARNGRDFASVNEATDHLMTEVMNRLKTIKPDIMIEFRQPYIGPLMRKFGNMLRGTDAPNDGVGNKVEIVNLRLMAGNTAVHSDMFIWRKEEPVESAALQILNILYSVPQLSVRLEEMPEKHLNMIRYWFKYWNNNRDILLDSKFVPGNPQGNFPIITAYDDKKQITTLYDDIIVKIEGKSIQNLDLINAKGSQLIALDLSESWDGNVNILDCEGKLILSQSVHLKPGINRLEAPLSGMIQLKRK
jgi:alpha-galactosidase